MEEKKFVPKLKEREGKKNGQLIIIGVQFKVLCRLLGFMFAPFVVSIS